MNAVCVQDKLEKRLEDTQYGLESRIIKLEESLTDTRNYVGDVQNVSDLCFSQDFSKMSGL